MAGGPAPTGPSASPLGQAWGYGIVLGVGFLFALGMVGDIFILMGENPLTKKGLHDMGS